MMRAVVTGGAGFIGSHLVERLSKDGHDVLVIDDMSSGRSRLEVLERAGAEIVESDIRSQDAADSAGSYSPDVVFNLAAQSTVPGSMADPVHDCEVNIVGALRMLEVAKQSQARFIATASGGAMYGELAAEERAFTESSDGLPTSPYGLSKRLFEDYLRVYQKLFEVPFVSLALANVYGPRQDPHGEAGVVAIFARRLLADEQCVIHGDGEYTRDYVFVADVVDAFVAAAERGRGETFNVGTGLETSVNDLFELIKDAAGVDQAPIYDEPRAGDALRSCLNVTKARTQLGWSPKVGLAEGLAATLASFG